MVRNTSGILHENVTHFSSCKGCLRKKLEELGPPPMSLDKGGAGSKICRRGDVQGCRGSLLGGITDGLGVQNFVIFSLGRTVFEIRHPQKPQLPQAPTFSSGSISKTMRPIEKITKISTPVSTPKGYLALNPTFDLLSIPTPNPSKPPVLFD